jgi:HSP20 family protein
MARYDPFEEMDRVFEQLRTRMWTPDGFGRSDFATPAFGGGINMDLKKHGDGFGSHATEGSSLRRRDGEYVFVSDLTGFETDEIDLRFEGDALVLAAETRLSDETTGDETASDEMMGDAIMGGEMTGDESAGEQMAGEETTSEKMTTDTDEIGVRREFTRSRRVSERVTIPEEVVEDEISATYRNGVSASEASRGSPDRRSGGVLEVHLPLVESEADEGGRKIDVAD